MNSLSTVRNLFILTLMSLATLAPAATDYGRPPIAVPPRLGGITDFWRPMNDPKASLRLEKKPLVVMIQDLHANVGVQKNIAAMLYRLNRANRDKGLLVCVEGA